MQAHAWKMPTNSASIMCTHAQELEGDCDDN